jgi:DNA replication initiation complex subunit (GINS family)
MVEAAMEEKRPMDPTRRLLRVFGVKVTDYEERTAALVERAAAATSRDEVLRLAAEAFDLTADLNARLRDVTAHVLDTQARVLTELRAAIDAGRE